MVASTHRLTEKHIQIHRWRQRQLHHIVDLIDGIECPDQCTRPCAISQSAGKFEKKNNVKCPHPASQSHDRISTFTIYWKTAMLWWIDDRGVNLVVSWSKCVEMQRWCWWLISWTEATTFQDLHNDVDRKWLDVLVNYNIWLALQDALQKKNQVWNCWSSKPQTIAK